MHTTFKIDYVQFAMLNRVETMIVSFFLFFIDLRFKFTYKRHVEKCQIDALNKCQLDLHVTTSNIRLHDNRIKYDTK